jgi:hypothetical protein
VSLSIKNIPKASFASLFFLYCYCGCCFWLKSRWCVQFYERSLTQIAFSTQYKRVVNNIIGLSEDADMARDVITSVDDYIWYRVRTRLLFVCFGFWFLELGWTDKSSYSKHPHYADQKYFVCREPLCMCIVCTRYFRWFLSIWLSMFWSSWNYSSASWTGTIMKDFSQLFANFSKTYQSAMVRLWVLSYWNFWGWRFLIRAVRESSNCMAHILYGSCLYSHRRLFAISQVKPISRLIANHFDISNYCSSQLNSKRFFCNACKSHLLGRIDICCVRCVGSRIHAENRFYSGGTHCYSFGALRASEHPNICIRALSSVTIASFRRHDFCNLHFLFCELKVWLAI